MASTAAADSGVWNDRVPSPDDLSSDWVTQTLRSAGIASDLSGISLVKVGTGQLGDTYRISLDHRAGSVGPATVIGKFAAADAASRETARQWTLYEREVRFYLDLAPQARIATACCYGGCLGPDGKFVLILEDLSPARTGDQLAGITEREAVLAIDQAAKLHASFWDVGHEPDYRWLETGPLAQPFYAPSIFRAAWPAFRDRYAELLTDDHRRVGDIFADRYENYSKPLDRPRCVTHNDFRPDNMLFRNNAPVPLRVVDWQSAALGHNAVDVAYLIGGAFSPADRRHIEPTLLARYLQTLTVEGIEGYSRADLDEDYRHFAFAGINVAVGAAIMVKRTERGDRMFTTMLDRHVHHVLDTGALDILRERG